MQEKCTEAGFIWLLSIYRKCSLDINFCKKKKKEQRNTTFSENKHLGTSQSHMYSLSH